MNDLFDQRDWDYRAGIIQGDGRPTWQAIVLAAIIPWLMALLAGAI